MFAAIVVFGGYMICIWLARRTPLVHENALFHKGASLGSTGPDPENLVDRRAATKDLEEHEQEFLNALPPDKRAEAKWALQRWGNTDLKKRGAGGAH